MIVDLGIKETSSLAETQNKANIESNFRSDFIKSDL